MIHRPSVFKEICSRSYSNVNVQTLPTTSKDDESFVQRLGLLKTLPVHTGCVNTICWNDNGQYILSGSDDQHLIITNGHNYKVEAKYPTSHNANIFSAKFMPCSGDTQIISCSGGGIILHTDLNRPVETFHNQFNCHGGSTTHEIVTIPQDPNTFLSCGEDGTVRCFDLRTKTSCNKPRCKDDILISCRKAVTALALNPTALNQLVVGCADSMVRIYDRRYLNCPPGDNVFADPFCTFMSPNFEEYRHYRITSIRCSPEGEDVLVSYSSDYLYLFNIKENSSMELKKPVRKMSNWYKLKAATLKNDKISAPPIRRLRLRGDWSDTGPDARPEMDITTVSLGQARPQLQSTMMQRITHVLSRMLNNPMTRAAATAGGQDLEQNLTDEDNESEVMDVEPNNATDPSSLTTGSQPTDSSSNNRITSRLSALRSLPDSYILERGIHTSIISFNLSQQNTSTNSTIHIDSNLEGNRSEDAEMMPPVPSTSENSNYLEESEKNVECEGNKDNCNNFEAEMKMKYVGHRNARTMIKEANFWGNDYVMSGSDCGHVFIWNRHTADVKMLLQADQHVVNCLQPHPTLPLLATSGIDHDIKLWAPILEEASFDTKMAKDLMIRNAVMLKETKDTVTVPATFMIRMLFSLNQIRNEERLRSRRRNEET